MEKLSFMHYVKKTRTKWVALARLQDGQPWRGTRSARSLHVPSRCRMQRKARHTGRVSEVAGDIPGGHTCTSMTTLYRPIPGSTTLRNQYTAICAGHTSIDVHMRPVSQRQARNAACNSSS